MSYPPPHLIEKSRVNGRKGEGLFELVIPGISLTEVQIAPVQKHRSTQMKSQGIEGTLRKGMSYILELLMHLMFPDANLAGCTATTIAMEMT